MRLPFLSASSEPDRLAALEKSMAVMEMRQQQIAALLAENLRLQNQMMVRQTQLLEVLAAGLNGGFPVRPQ